VLGKCRPWRRGNQYRPLAAGHEVESSQGLIRREHAFQSSLNIEFENPTRNSVLAFPQHAPFLIVQGRMVGIPHVPSVKSVWSILECTRQSLALRKFAPRNFASLRSAPSKCA
jgi:hypothetical protein